MHRNVHTYMHTYGTFAYIYTNVYTVHTCTVHIYIHTSFSTFLHFFLALSLENTEDLLLLLSIDCCDDCDALETDVPLYLCTRRNAATYV